jgi:hypothetical protein
MAVLGIIDVTSLLKATPPLDQATALAEADTWLAERDPDEAAARDPIVALSNAPSRA